jgi:hypothetical protein
LDDLDCNLVYNQLIIEDKDAIAEYTYKFALKMSPINGRIITSKVGGISLNLHLTSEIKTRWENNICVHIRISTQMWWGLRSDQVRLESSCHLQIPTSMVEDITACPLLQRELVAIEIVSGLFYGSLSPSEAACASEL